jgi:phage gpG-like protein
MATLKMEIVGLRKTLERFKTMQANMEQPAPALLRAGAVIRDHAVQRFTQGGGDQTWPPTLRGGTIGVDTGRMRSSIAVTLSGTRAVTVGTNVPYARWFQFGTGIYVGRPPITAKNGRALSFTVNGVKYVRQSVKGQPPRPFLLIVDADRQKIKKIFARFATAKPTGA